MRLFIAIEFPNDIKNELSTLRVDIPGARWVSVNQIHLTLAFLGEIEEIVINQLTEKLTSINLPEFQICFSEAGCFPDRWRPRVLWIGLEPEPCLKNLAVKIREVVQTSGISLEERSFSPHITLARLKLPASREVCAFLNQNRKLKLPVYRVREFTLFQSRLTSHGTEHIPIKKFPLTSLAIA